MSLIADLSYLDFCDFKSMTPHKTGYDATKSLYQIKPSIYAKFRGNARTHIWRGGAKCVICLDRKPANTARWCRGCDACICAGCYRSLKATAEEVHYSLMPIIYDKDDQEYRESKSLQPSCPTCREEGLFAPQGIRATRVIKYNDNYYGPNVSVDTKLQKYMTEYVDEYNKILTTIFIMNDTRRDEDKANWKKFYDSVVIKDINKTIDDKEKQIKKLKEEVGKLKKDKEEWKKINFSHKSTPVNTQTLIDAGISFSSDWTTSAEGSQDYVYHQECDFEHSLNNILRKVNAYPKSMTMKKKFVVNGDWKIARQCEFSRFGGLKGSRGVGGIGIRDQEIKYIFTKLNDKYIKITQRFDDLICGLAIPIPPISVQAVSMTDDEIEAKMAEMMAIMEARKKNKN